MHNWSIDEKQFKKTNPKAYKIWHIEQMINYGSDSEKLDEKEVRRYWFKIKDNLDPYKKRLLEFILWKKIYSLPDNLTFWSYLDKTKK